MDEQLVGYVLNGLPTAEMAAVQARLAQDPDAVAAVARLRRLLTLLPTDEPVPPAGLAVATIGAVAAHAVANGLLTVEPSAVTLPNIPLIPSYPPPRPTDHSPGRTYLTARLAELAILAAGVFLVVGLAVTGVMKLRRESQLADCRNGLQQLHTALTGYADTHADRYPQVGTQALPRAGDFVTALTAAGQLTDPERTTCVTAQPTVSGDTTAYAYTLGYRENDALRPLRRGAVDGNTPVVADLPKVVRAGYDRADSGHGRGVNVLTVGGDVQFVTTVLAGPKQDHIFLNDAGRIGAGLHRLDTALGRADDVP